MTLWSQIVDDLRKEVWLIGVAVGLFGSFCGALGGVLMRRSFLKGPPTRFPLTEQPQPSDPVANLNWYWFCGAFLTVAINPIATLISLSFTPATIVTSMAGVHVLLNMLLAKLYLKETTVIWDYVGSVLVGFGISVVVTFAGKEQKIFTMEQLFDHLSTTSCRVYVGVFLTVLLISLCSSNNRVSGCIAGRTLGRTWQRFAFSTTSGMCGGVSNLFAKALMVCLVPAIAGGWSDCGPVLRNWRFWCVLGGTLVFAVAQVLLLNASLRKYEAIYVVPSINSVLIGSGSLGAIVLFDEQPRSPLFLTIGLALVVSGMISLSYGKYESDFVSPERVEERGFVRLASRDSQVAPVRYDPSTVQTELRDQTEPKRRSMWDLLVEQVASSSISMATWEDPDRSPITRKSSSSIVAITEAPTSSGWKAQLIPSVEKSTAPTVED